LKQYETISQYLCRKWDEDSALHPQRWEWNGCLEKLATAILQIERLSNHQNHLLTQAINNIIGRNASDAVFLASEVSSDFESLLLHGRAALDRLTNFISRHYGNYTDRIRIPVFSKITLSGFQYTEKDVDNNIIANAISFMTAFPKRVKGFRKDGWIEIGKLSSGKILLVR
jgi:hypothetical protein